MQLFCLPLGAQTDQNHTLKIIITPQSHFPKVWMFLKVDIFEDTMGSILDAD